jgi:hypothetical protein
MLLFAMHFSSPVSKYPVISAMGVQGDGAGLG